MSTVFRTTTWPPALAATATASATASSHEGISWSVFSKQYYCVSNWNATGLSADYKYGNGQTALLICRDGIPGFSWYHLYLSHFSQFKKVSAMLQLRFSMIGLQDRRPEYRIGGNIRTTWSMSGTLRMQVSLYDFYGWILPGRAVARGDPAMQFLLFHEPGRLVGLVAGFMLNRSQSGPVTMGVRLNMNDRIALTGLFNVLPFGLSFGITCLIDRYGIDLLLDHTNRLGATPQVVLRRNL